MKDQRSEAGGREMRSEPGPLAYPMNQAYVNSVLFNIADGGWSRVTPRQMYDVIDHLKELGIGHLTRDPDLHRVWDRLTSDDPTSGWASIHPDDLRLFALAVLEWIDP